MVDHRVRGSHQDLHAKRLDFTRGVFCSFEGNSEFGLGISTGLLFVLDSLGDVS